MPSKLASVFHSAALADCACSSGILRLSRQPRMASNQEIPAKEFNTVMHPDLRQSTMFVKSCTATLLTVNSGPDQLQR